VRKRDLRDFEKWRNSLEGVLYELYLSPPAATKADIQIEHLIARTLLKLPKKIRERVLYEYAVRFIAIGRETHGHFLMSVCQPHSEPKPMPEIFLHFSAMRRMSEKRKMATIAHEIAHFILGHGSLAPSEENVEKKADDLCEKWGFGRAYTRRQIRDMERQRMKMLEWLRERKREREAKPQPQLAREDLRGNLLAVNQAYRK